MCTSKTKVKQWKNILYKLTSVDLISPISIINDHAYTPVSQNGHLLYDPHCISVPNWKCKSWFGILWAHVSLTPEPISNLTVFLLCNPTYISSWLVFLDQDEYFLSCQIDLYQPSKKTLNVMPQLWEILLSKLLTTYEM